MTSYPCAAEDTEIPSIYLQREFMPPGLWSIREPNACRTGLPSEVRHE